VFFTKKKEPASPVPSERIDSMISKGMSDRDIIKTLKSEGYSYEQIEGAMMNAVKSGVDEPAPPPPTQRSALPDMEMPDAGSTEVIEPEQIVEELIESVVENKWKKFDVEIERLNAETNSIRETLRSRPQPQKTGDDERVSAFSSQIDDLTARVGGLEKAFRQFLPSLTKNIESLSNIIHEMKAKQRIQ